MSFDSGAIQRIQQLLQPIFDARYALKTTATTTLPTIARDGTVLRYKALATATGSFQNAVWTLVYDAADGYWYPVGADALVATSGGAGLSTAGGTTYIASGSSITAPLGGDYTVRGISHIYTNNSGSNADSRMSAFVNGSASGPEGALIGPSGTDGGISVATDPVGVTAGQAIDLRYKSSVASANVVFFSFRIEVTPKRVH